MISEDMLKQAVTEADQILLDNLPAPDECPVHTFSPAFEKKMRKLMRKAKHPILFPLLRYAACIIISVGVIGGTWLACDVEAREFFLKWGKNIYEHYIHYRFEGDQIAPTDADYTLSWIPDDFFQTDSIEMDPVYGYLYSNANGNWIRFNYTKGSDTANLYIYNENAKYENIFIGHQSVDLYFYDGEDPYYDLVWYLPNGTQFLLSSSLSKEEVIKIAENVAECDS